ncbi:hypothetical protein LTR16_002324 [Cryomyces antarcticus]|uniref:Uncharacterized protein n=1 Tax=Cryomyces antarcticus TaxID=329879 RepID=A0ABR0LYP1_9PEZI|nr:hypothetical protein LTR16_002324 [Cryomyces antarcticus]
MSSLRQASTLRTALLRPFLLATSPRTVLPLTAQRFASGGYGSGAGDPKGEKPQSQGSNPASSDLEHPGPPPPKVGQGTGGATKADSQGHMSDAQQQGGSSGSASASSGSQSGAEGQKGAQPKIHDVAPPSEDHSEDVRKHNADMKRDSAEKPHDQASEETVEKDKVGKAFWSGHGGADREP